MTGVQTCALPIYDSRGEFGNMENVDGLKAQIMDDVAKAADPATLEDRKSVV